jgi:hypothetical protein
MLGIDCTIAGTVFCRLFFSIQWREGFTDMSGGEKAGVSISSAW